MQPLYSQMEQAMVKVFALKMSNAFLTGHTSYSINCFDGNTIQLHLHISMPRAPKYRFKVFTVTDGTQILLMQTGAGCEVTHCWWPEIWTLVVKRCCKYHSIHKSLNTLLLYAVAVWQDMSADKSVLLDLLPSSLSAKVTHQKAFFLNRTSIPDSQY